MNRHTKHLLFFLGGVATGTAVGLLFAPDSGRNTRSRIKSQVDLYMEKLNELIKLNKEVSKDDNNKFKDLNADDYHRAEELLSEVEGLLAEIKSKS